MNERKRITAITINQNISTKEVRRRFRAVNNNKEDCFVCCGYGLITESHHVVHVNEVASLMRKGRIVPPFSVPVVWLCPNHHKIIHLLDQKTNTEVFSLLSKPEILALTELEKVRNSWWEKIFEVIRNGN